MRWLVEVGDVVAVDQPVVEVETAKAMVEVPCPYGGVVTARFGEEGAELPVGAPLLTVAVGAADRPRSAGAASGRSGSGRRRREPTASRQRAGRVRHRRTVPRRRTARAPAPRRSAQGPARPPRPAGRRPAARRRRSGAGPAPTAVRRCSGPWRRTGPVAVISPLVRRLARQNGLDLRE